MQGEDEKSTKTLADYKKMLLDAGYTLYTPAYITGDDGWFYYSDGEAFVYVQARRLMIVRPALLYDFSCKVNVVDFVYGVPVELTLDDFEKFIEDAKRYINLVMCEKKFMKFLAKRDYIRHEKLIHSKKEDRT